MDELKRDYLGTVRKTAGLGYEGVEFPTGLIGAVKKEDLRGVLNVHGIEAIGAVFSLEEIEERSEEIFDYLRFIDAGYVIYFGFTEPRASKDEIIRDAERLNKIGRMANDSGFKFLYHIHGHELYRIDGDDAFDILFTHLDTDAVQLQIDVYWVEWAGVDSVGFMSKYGAVCPCLHLKDMADRALKTDIEVGDGALDMESIMRIGKKYNASWFITEQEAFTMPTMKSIEISLRNMKELQSRLS